MTTTKTTTRTLFGVKLVKQSKEIARQSGASSLWLTEDGRFELRGDDTIEFGADRSEIEWGVWDRNERGGEGDWADGGRGNGVQSFNEGAKMIARVLADEAKGTDIGTLVRRIAAVDAASHRPAALAHIGSVSDEQTKVLQKISRLMVLASNAVTEDDRVKMGTTTAAKVLLAELEEAFVDMARADLISSIESQGLHIPDNAR